MRRRLAAVFTLGLAATVLTAVGRASAKVTDWTGHHIGEVITKFGPPTRTVPTADGGKMCIWEYERSVAEPSWGRGPGGPTVSTQGNTDVATTMFWVRPDGIIASWNVQDCPVPTAGVPFAPC